VPAFESPSAPADRQFEQPVTVVVDHATTVAALLDDARSRVDALEVRGYRPERVAVPRAAYELIVSAKQAEHDRYGDVFLFGLDLVALDDVGTGR
jgi:hypothetical protein